MPANEHHVSLDVTTVHHEELIKLRDKYHELNNGFVKASVVIENLEKQIEEQRKANELVIDKLQKEIKILEEKIEILKEEKIQHKERSRIIDSTLKYSKPLIALIGSVVMLFTLSKDKASEVVLYGLQHLAQIITK